MRMDADEGLERLRDAFRVLHCYKTTYHERKGRLNCSVLWGQASGAVGILATPGVLKAGQDDCSTEIH